MFSGALKDGKPTNLGHCRSIAGDRTKTLALGSTEDGKDRQVGLAINDRPDQPVDFPAVARLVQEPSGATRDAAVRAAGAAVMPRAFLGRALDKSSVLAMRDAAGRKRLEVRVGADGKASIDFLDADGRVSRSITGS
ncbi:MULTISPECIES: hypothetical protein [unclassified Sphingomonas]|uniref:hypothetical protein n=1 Tax=unclassified Sphingomonas TaxID=196159 RepID=UPI000E10E6D2|nr:MULTISPECIES: hypothetical protein [unclassified Sphingomonas]AXJ96131.1 hypothetical protein DM480_12100 [Sphingomonas sp. FARSPH]